MTCGTPTGYTHFKCRCPACTEAVRIANAEYRRKTHHGLKRLTVNARQARKHLEYLHSQGYSARTLAALTGIRHSVFHDISTQQVTRIHLKTHEKILGVTISDCRQATKGRQPAEPSLRLLREFLGMGYTQTWIRRQMGGYDLLAQNPKGVAQTVATRVQALHDKHWRENINNFRRHCSCYGVSDLQIKRQKDAENKRQERARKAQAC